MAGEKREILSERPEIRLTERVYGAINEMYVRCKNGGTGVKYCEEQPDRRAADKKYQIMSRKNREEQECCTKKSRLRQYRLDL